MLRGFVVGALFAISLAKAGTPAASFTASGPGGLDIKGSTNELDVNESSGTVKVTVKLAGIDTGIALRNRHMRDKYLETDKYPTAELTVPRADLKLPADGAEVDGSANGQMTIHGKTKTVSFKYHAKRSGSSFDVTGSTRVNMNDYGISVPSYLGVTVKPDVDINVRFAASDP